MKRSMVWLCWVMIVLTILGGLLAGSTEADDRFPADGALLGVLGLIAIHTDGRRKIAEAREDRALARYQRYMARAEADWGDLAEEEVR